jgi:sugar phosphate isomerase/epimerase
MRIGSSHLGYCTNIHPGEAWHEIDDNLRRWLPAVKARVCPDRPFGVGLRLGGRAVEALGSEPERRRLQAFLDEEGLYVFTVNGFPYGSFHRTRVKEQVYRPDWLEDERLFYSNRLADVLAHLLPESAGFGTVSTVPGAFGPRVRSERDEAAIAHRLAAHAAHLSGLFDRTGKHIALALEPEPCCHFETVHESIRFFQEHIFAREAVRLFGELTGVHGEAAAERLRRHIGVCLDACHMAVEFESPAGALTAFERAGIAVPKIQLSAGIELRPEDGPAGRAAIARFADGVYLHQVVIRTEAGLERHTDLAGALADAGEPRAGTWRVHFHVPLFVEDLGRFRTTQPQVADLARALARDPTPRHLEVETYTWDVLPPEHRAVPVDEAIARELR